MTTDTHIPKTDHDINEAGRGVFSPHFKEEIIVLSQQLEIERIYRITSLDSATKTADRTVKKKTLWCCAVYTFDLEFKKYVTFVYENERKCYVYSSLE